MEEDIVKRLRDPRWVKHNPEAADVIEELRRNIKNLVSLLHEAIALPQGQCPRPSTAADGWYNPHSLKLKGGSDAKVN